MPKKGDHWGNKKKTPAMLKFERETKKNAVFKGKVTGQFEYWQYWETHEKPPARPRGRPKGKGKRTNKHKQLTQEEVKVLYARKFRIRGGAKNVKTNTRKFKEFAAEMLAKKTT